MLKGMHEILFRDLFGVKAARCRHDGVRSYDRWSLLVGDFSLDMLIYTGLLENLNFVPSDHDGLLHRHIR